MRRRIVDLVPLQLRDQHRRRLHMGCAGHLDLAVRSQFALFLRPIHRERVVRIAAVENAQRDDQLGLLLSDHAPEVGDRLRQRRLGQNESSLLFQRIDVTERRKVSENKSKIFITYLAWM